MAKNTRQQFVQAKLKATGKEATPEQRAKLRERFNTLSETKEGRTKIAQTILPSGTVSDRAALKKSLKPPPQNTTTSTTGVTGGVNTPPGSSASSAVVPGAKITSPSVQFGPPLPSKKIVKRVDPGYTPSYPSTYVPTDTARFLQNKNVPGLRLIPKIGQEFDKGNYLGSAGRVVQAAAEIRLATKFLGKVGAGYSKNVLQAATAATKVANKKASKEALKFYKNLGK